MLSTSENAPDIIESAKCPWAWTRRGPMLTAMHMGLHKMRTRQLYRLHAYDVNACQEADRGVLIPWPSEVGGKLSNAKHGLWLARVSRNLSRFFIAGRRKERLQLHPPRAPGLCAFQSPLQPLLDPC